MVPSSLFRTLFIPMLSSAIGMYALCVGRFEYIRFEMSVAYPVCVSPTKYSIPLVPSISISPSHRTVLTQSLPEACTRRYSLFSLGIPGRGTYHHRMQPWRTVASCTQALPGYPWKSFLHDRARTSQTPPFARRAIFLRRVYRRPEA